MLLLIRCNLFTHNIKSTFQLLKRNSICYPMTHVKCVHSGEYVNSQTKVSALYVSGDRGQSVFGVLSPYMDISGTLENLHELEANLKLRGMTQDLSQLLQSWKDLQIQVNRKTELEAERNIIANTLKALMNRKLVDESDDLVRLKEQGRAVREDLKVLSKKVADLEDTVVLAFLQLPNKLHTCVSHKDKVLMTFFNQPSFEFEVRGHREIGKLKGELEFKNCSPTAYYLLNKLAALELSCTDYFSSLLQSHGYVLHSNPDFAKGVIVEGSGINVSDIHKVLMLSKEDNDHNALYLVGGGSLQAFVSYYTKQIINNTKSLPQKLVSIGRHYSPSHDESNGLLNSWQSTVVDSFILFEHTSSYQENMLNEVLMVLVKSYTQLKQHFLVKQYSAHTLQPHESAAFGILMFSPKSKTYHEVGRISICGDYISKRLLTLLKISNDSASFLSMFHVRVCNVTSLLALIMENGQQESGTYDIPDCLKDFLYV